MIRIIMFLIITLVYQAYSAEDVARRDIVFLMGDCECFVGSIVLDKQPEQPEQPEGATQRISGRMIVDTKLWGHIEKSELKFADEGGPHYFHTSWMNFADGDSDNAKAFREGKPMVICCRIQDDSAVMSELGFAIAAAKENRLIEAFTRISKELDGKVSAKDRLESLKTLASDDNGYVLDYATVHLLYWYNMDFGISERAELSIGALASEKSSPQCRRYIWEFLSSAIRSQGKILGMAGKSIARLEQKLGWKPGIQALADTNISFKIEEKDQKRLVKWIAAHLSDYDKIGKIHGVAIKGKLEMLKTLMPIVKSDPDLLSDIIKAIDQLEPIDIKMGATLIDEIRSIVRTMQAQPHE